MRPRTDNRTGNTYIAIDKKDTGTKQQFFKCMELMNRKTYLGTLRELIHYYLKHEKDINEEMTTEKKANETHLCTNPNSYYYMTQINPSNKYEDCYMSIKCKSCAHMLTRGRK